MQAASTGEIGDNAFRLTHAHGKTHEPMPQLMPQPDLATLIEEYLDDCDASWGIGVPGAVAEFFQDAGEARAGPALGRRTPRGAIAIYPHAAMRALAIETPSRAPERWLQRLAMTLPAAAARRETHRSIRELGPDPGTLTPGTDREVLFDLGLGIAHVSTCIRTAQPHLLARMRAHEGEALLGGNGEVLGALIESSPARVFISNIARIEVYQPIAATTTPEGPHTHLLPHLLREHTTCTGTGPVSCLDLYPANPLLDKLGRAIPFDAGKHARFQRLVARYAPPAVAQCKRRVRRALAQGIRPDDFDPPRDDGARAALRIAIRQAAQDTTAAELIEAWRSAFDIDPQ